MRNHCLLYLNTTLSFGAEIALIAPQGVFKKKFTVGRRLSERLLSTLDRFLRSGGCRLEALTTIVVVIKGGSFTALRSGVVVANALGYALGIPVYGSAASLGPEALKALSLVRGRLKGVTPMYAAPPHITRPKRKNSLEPIF